MAIENYKMLQLTAQDLMSGSADTMRTAHGGFYEVVEDSTEEGTTLEFIEAQATMMTDPDTASPFIDYGPFMIGGPWGKMQQLQVDAATPISTDVLVPNMKIPLRIAGDSDAVKSDYHWKVILVGGVFGDEVYSPIYNQKVHSYFNLKYGKPYSATEYLTLKTYSQETITASYDYNLYLPEYQQYIDTLDSELLLPNIDLFYDVVRSDYDLTGSLGDIALYPQQLINFLTLEGNYGSVSDILDYNPVNLAYEPYQSAAESLIANIYSDTWSKNTNLTVNYLTGAYVRTTYSGSTQQWVKSKLKNILYDNTAVEIRTDSYGPFYETAVSKAPYKVKIKFPHDSGDISDWYGGAESDYEQEYFLNSIRDSNFSSKFIKELYRVFGEKDDDLSADETKYIETLNYLTASSGTNDTTTIINEVEGSTTATYREVEYMKFLAHCYNNYLSPDDENYFMGPATLTRLSADDINGAYRHINTEATLGVIKDTVAWMSGSDNMAVTHYLSILGEHFGHVETLAYRVQKIGGNPDISAYTQNTLQNFWLMKNDVQDFLFYDTQVKYDAEYTYKVYAYVLVGGFKYKYSDLAVSRQLGCELSASGDIGLELYNPYVEGEPATDYIWEGPTVGQFNQDATDSQVFSQVPYIADMYLNIEPSLRIVEIPIYSKTFKVQDNPASTLNIVPYQPLNNTHKIGYDLTFGKFSTDVFPDTISDDDEQYKQSYLHAKGYIESSDIIEESVSLSRYIQIYRLTERPTALTDFDGALHAELDLSMADIDLSKNSYTNTHYNDTVTPNQKYYYLFRVLNQQRNLSHLSEIYEAELINDGGYLYALFNVIYHYEIEEEVYINPTKSFKKLFQLQPNMQQVQLVTDDADFTSTAADQIGNIEVGIADDLIWNKTFKIRLTSKKTGRKIDLNITYNLNSD
tara:strand:- start:9008 stop:11758 length:2751 start_codon:yes stop_codon:yes gene_type:complete